MGPSEQAERARVAAALDRLAAGDAERRRVFEAEAEASFAAVPPSEPAPDGGRELTGAELEALMAEMDARGPILLHGPTRAARSGSRDALVGALVVDLARHESFYLGDWRDLLVMLAPFHDCARRLGIDVPAVFEEAAAAASSELAGHIRELGRRTDVSPRSFGYSREEEPDGPAYYSRL